MYIRNCNCYLKKRNTIKIFPYNQYYKLTTPPIFSVTAIIFVILNLSPDAEGKKAANAKVNNEDEELSRVTTAVSVISSET